MKYIPEIMCLIDDNEIPLNIWKTLHQLRGIIIGSDDNTNILCVRQLFSPT